MNNHFSVDFCKNNNGNCEQICLTTHGGVGGGLKKVCACGYGFELQPDGRTCKSGMYETNINTLPFFIE